MTVLDLAKKRRKIYPVMGNDGVKCTLSRGNFPLPRDFCLFFQNCHVEYLNSRQDLQDIDFQLFKSCSS